MSDSTSSKRWIWVLALGLLSGMSVKGQTLLEARPLLSSETMAYRASFIVDIERRGANTRGDLIVRDASGMEQVVLFDLAMNARKRLHIGVPVYRAYQDSYQLTTSYIQWRGADGERVNRPLTPPSQAHIPVVVVGNMIGGLERVNGVKAGFISVVAVWYEELKAPIKVYYMRPTDLPDDWHLLLELPVIVLVEGAETLSDSQRRALHRWLVAGGTLMVSVGSFGLQLRQSPVGRLLSDVGVLDSARSRAARSLVRWRPVGLGEVCLFMEDLSQPTWRAWDKLPGLFRLLALGKTFPSERLRMCFGVQPPFLPQPSTHAKVWSGVAIQGLYLGLVWALVAWLRRRRMLKSIFAPLVALSLIGSVAIWLFPPRPQVSEPTVLSLLYQSASEDTVAVKYFDGVLEAGRHTIQLPEDTILLDWSVQPWAKVRLSFTGAAPVLQLQSPMRVRVRLCCAHPARSRQKLEAWELGDRLLLLNLSSQELADVQILSQKYITATPKVLWKQPRLGSNRVAWMRLENQQREHHLWALAKYSGEPSTVLIDGKPVQEVSYLCVLVP